jgi:hypothetical protein
MINLPQDIKDRIRVKLYNEFYKKNLRLYKENIAVYWQTCSRYVEDNYRLRLEEESRKFDKLSGLEKKVQRPKKHWWQRKK